jgi:polygalacturonase
MVPLACSRDDTGGRSVEPPPTTPAAAVVDRPVAHPGTPAGDLEPDVQVSPYPEACRPTSLAGQRIDGVSYLTLTNGDDVASVEWAVDDVLIGASDTPPFVPRDSSGAVVPLPVGLLPGTHEVTARTADATGKVTVRFGMFTTTSDPSAAPDAAAGVVVSTPAGVGALSPWQVLRGVVTLDAPAEWGTLTLDGWPYVRRTAIDLDALAPGRHVVDGERTLSPTTFVSTGGREVPAGCGVVDVTDYGARGDGVTDDSAALVAALDVAMGSGADLRLPTGTYAVPTIKNVRIERDVRITGDAGAVLDAGRPREKYTMFSVGASVRFEGITVRNAGKVFALDGLTRTIDRFVVDRSVFEHVWSPAHVSAAPDQLVRMLELRDNRATDAVKGFYLPLTLIEHARVSGNTVTDVGDAAIRIGSDRDESFGAQRDIDVRENVVRRVTGESDANGIKVLGVDGVITANEVRDVASDDGTDSEGIYTKGYGHLISDNLLVDAGRTQAQITVKSDSTTIANNTIVTEAAQTNGIRIEGSDVVVTDNRIVGGLTDSVGITTKLTDGVGGYRFERNLFTDTDGTAISVGGQGPIVIRANEFADVRGSTAVRIRATRADTTDVLVEKNTVASMGDPSATAFVLESRAGRTLSSVRIDDNTVSDAATAVAFDVEPDARIVDVDLRRNSFFALRGEDIRGEDEVERLVTDRGDEGRGNEGKANGGGPR